jgi:ABC-type multidrug transport system ATPase subunit
MALVIENLTLAYGQKSILGPLSLRQSPERSLAIIGPSASGKTSLAKAILGLGNFSLKGCLYFDGWLLQKDHTIVRPLNLRKFGYVPESPACWPHLSVKDAVLLAIKLSKAEPRLGEELIRDCGLEQVLHRKAHQLSLGQRARLTIACTLAADPKLVILDEALSSLDIVNKMILINLIKTRQKQCHFALIFITHDIAESLKLADDILLLQNGHKLWHGPKEQLKKAPFSYDWNPLTSPLLQPFSNL